MFDATSTDRNLPSAHRHEPPPLSPAPESGSHLAARHRALLQAVVASLGSTGGSTVSPSMMPRLLRGIGQELRRSARQSVETAQGAEAETHKISLHEQLFECLQQLEAQWGCRYQIGQQRPDRLELAILDCPCEPHHDQPLHLCWLYSGMLGEAAGGRLNFVKASVLPGTRPQSLAETAETCRIILYLQKTADSVAAEGTTYPQDEQALDHRPSRPRTGLPLDRLSDREWQVLRLIGEGFTDKQIASALLMSVRTAENHASKVYRKLGVRGRARLIRYALRHRIVNL